MRVPLGLRLKYTLGRYLPFLKITPPIDRQMVYTLRPVRNGLIAWERTPEGEAILHIPRRDDRFGRIMAFIFKIPEARAVQLDEVGAFVWGLCDGEHSVDGIVQRTCKEYKMNRREVEISVTTYLKMLAERNFIGFYQRGGKTK